MMPAVHVRWSLVAGLPCDEIELSPEERDTHAHIRDQRRAGEWLAGRILVKRWLAERLESGVRPADITVVSTDGFGRSVAPRAFWRGRMLPERFSIAHAAGMVLVTLASRPDVRVGADVVPLQAVAPHRLAMWMTAAETAWVHSATPELSVWRAGALWACKEAVYKAVNRTEAFRPADISVEPRDGDVWQANAAGQCSHVRPIELGGHVGAAATFVEKRGSV
jgi:phosphopantetheinyl transferase